MIDWDKLRITVLKEEEGVLVETDRVYTIQAENRMVVLGGAKGEKGDPGESGNATWGYINGLLQHQSDLWGLLYSKADKVSLGTMSSVNDAPIDGKQYARKDGSWDEVESGGSGDAVWGLITGDLDDQTDLKNALDDLQDEIDLSKTVEDIDVQHTAVDGEFYVGTGVYPTYISAYLPLKQTGSGTPSAQNIRPFEIYDSIALKEYRGMNRVRYFTDVPEGAGYTINFLTGVGKMTYGYIASYNGEDINELSGKEATYWWSDRDDNHVYFPLSEPTLGAEVVYELRNPVLFKVKKPTSLMGDVTYAVETGQGSTFTTATDSTVYYALSTDDLQRVDIKTYIDDNDNEVRSDILDMTDRVNLLYDRSLKGDAPSDGVTYGRKDGEWAPVSGGGGGGDAVWGLIQGTLSNQTDLQTALNAKANTSSLGTMATVNDASVDNNVYGRKNGGWESIPNLAWGNISGTLSNQNDLKNALDAKSNTTDLGGMAFIDDAHLDGKQYARQNGSWVEVSSQGSAAWGNISGTLSNQTDLKNALDAKADTADLGDLATKDTVDWDTDIDDIPNAFPPESHTHDDRYYTESETDALLADKADSSDLGDLATKDTVDWDTDIDDIPTTFPPSSHTHDDRYYTETEIDTALSAKANTADLGDLATKDTVDWDTDIDDIPTTFPPSSHTHDDRYYTESEVDTALSGKVNISGDTMTGDLNIEKDAPMLNLVNLNMDVAGSTFDPLPAATLFFRDKNDLQIGRVQCYQNSTGRSTVSISARHKVNNTNVDNGFSVGVNADGTKYVSITDPDKWLSALGLDDSGWLAATPNTTGGVNRYSGTIYYRKIWKTVEVVAEDIQLTNNLEQGNYIHLSQLPSGYRPSYRVFGSGGFRSGTSVNIFNPFPVSISSAGQINVSGVPDGISNSQYLTLHIIFNV